MANFVIIGGGITGVTAAEQLRKKSPESVVTLIEREIEPLYSRVLLPHYIKGVIPREKVFLKAENWYQKEGIEWLRGVEVTAIDTKNKFVTISEGREIPYDALLIATGGEVNLMPDAKEGIVYFRTLADADEILSRCEELKGTGGTAVVLGGGFISFEFINIFAHFGIPFEIILRGKGFFGGMLLPELSEMIKAHVTKAGYKIHDGVEIKEVLGETAVEGVTLTNEATIPCRMIGAGIGIHPERALIEGSPLVLKKGLLVNEYLETETPGVFASGDVAEYFDLETGRHRVFGNWMNAQMQGRLVAENMAGGKKPFSLVSSYATNVLKKELTVIGDTDPSFAEARILRKTEEDALQVFERDGKTVGAVIFGSAKERGAITKAIQQKERYA